HRPRRVGDPLHVRKHIDWEPRDPNVSRGRSKTTGRSGKSKTKADDERQSEVRQLHSTREGGEQICAGGGGGAAGGKATEQGECSCERQAPDTSWIRLAGTQHIRRN